MAKRKPKRDVEGLSQMRKTLAEMTAKLEADDKAGLVPGAEATDDRTRLTMALLNDVPERYKYQVKRLVRHLLTNGHDIADPKSWRSFMDSLVVKQPEGSGRMAGKTYSASAINTFLCALEDRIRWLANQDDTLTEIARYRIEKELSDLRADKKRHPKRAKPKPKFIEPEQVWKLVEQIPQSHSDGPPYQQQLDRQFALLVTFLFTTGLRISEALGLTIVQFKRANAHYEATFIGKGQIERRVEIDAALYDSIRAEFSHATTYLFEGKTGKPMNRSHVGMRLSRYAQRILGIPVTPHMLRHSVATGMFKAGADVLEVCDFLGHASATVTLNTYLHGEMTWERKQHFTKVLGKK